MVERWDLGEEMDVEDEVRQQTCTGHMSVCRLREVSTSTRDDRGLLCIFVTSSGGGAGHDVSLLVA